jgi:hypothetical protein
VKFAFLYRQSVAPARFQNKNPRRGAKAPRDPTSFIKDVPQCAPEGMDGLRMDKRGIAA